MSFQTKRTSTLNDKEALRVLEIWNQVYPVEACFESFKDFCDYVEGLDQAHHWLVSDHGGCVAWLCTFSRENQPWFVILVDPVYQGQGIGRDLMKELMEQNDELYGWIVPKAGEKKRDGSDYRSPRPFYEALGFSLTERILKKKAMETTMIVWKKDSHGHL